jgi:hypothetical protein
MQPLHYGETILDDVTWVEYAERIRFGIDASGNPAIEVPKAEAFEQPHRVILLSNDEVVALIEALKASIGWLDDPTSDSMTGLAAGQITSDKLPKGNDQ